MQPIEVPRRKEGGEVVETVAITARAIEIGGVRPLESRGTARVTIVESEEETFTIRHLCYGPSSLLAY